MRAIYPPCLQIYTFLLKMKPQSDGKLYLYALKNKE